MKSFKKALALLTAVATVSAFSIPAAFAADETEYEFLPEPEELVSLESETDEVSDEVETLWEELDESDYIIDETDEPSGVKMTVEETDDYDDALPVAVSGTITLEKNVKLAAQAVIDTDTVLDLNGFSIERGDGNTDNFLISVSSGAELTVKDGDSGGEIYSANFEVTVDETTSTMAGNDIYVSGR